MKKVQAGILFGVIAGIIDVIPMILQKLSWDANLSAFSMWIVVGFLISTSDLKLNGALKGLLIAFLVVIPIVVLVAAMDPISLVPIGIMTLILGSLLGYLIEKF